jgi:hypothetical protein
MTTLFKSAFNQGILSPRLGGRIDLAKYESALGLCDNMLPQPWGGVVRRMGTEFINECSTAGKRSRLIPFRYSTEQAYIIEVGDEYMRFYMDGGLIQSNDASTVALLHMDGISSSQLFTDSSTYNKTVTVGGDVKIDTSDGVFKQCAVFDGTVDYLSMADSAHWYMADLPLTVDFRVKFSALPAANEVMTLFIQRADEENYAWFTLENNGSGYYLTLELRTAGVSTYPLDAMAGWTPVVNTWYHLALIRGWGGTLNSWNICIGGVSLGAVTVAATWPNVAGAFQIGIEGSDDALYPVEHSDTYVKATNKFDVTYWPYFATDPSLPLTGVSGSASWTSTTLTNANQRFHIDLGVTRIVNRIYYENYHHSGGTTNSGSKTFTFWGSSDAADFAALNYASTGTWVQINTSTNIFAQHVASDVVDPKYITATNTTAYRYYGFKIADNWGGTTLGLRRIALNPITNIAFNGKIDEFRISKDIARWTAAFVPPTTTYPLGVAGGNSDYSLSSPYLESDLRDIYYTQSADTLYPTHPNYAPRTLVRAHHDDWTLGEITFDWPPFLNEATTAKTMTPTQFAIGSVSVTASASTFSDDYVGASLHIGSGYLNIASVQSATLCSGSIVATLGTATAATTEWYKSAWDEVSGYPSCVTFFEQRLAYAATNEEEQTIWMSVSGDFYNHNPKVGATISDTDACSYTIDADEVNRVHFLVPSKKLVAGTEGGIFHVSGNQDDGITPSNIKVRLEAAEQACDEVMPIKFGNSVLFTERGGRILREFAYNFQSDSNEAKDLIILAEHLTRNNSIIEIALQRIPFKVIWCVLDDGKVISLTYLKEHDVVGWTLHDLGGDAESVACIPGTTDDEVWFIVKRTIGGSIVRYIERMKTNFSGLAEEDAFYVDSGLSYNGVPTTSISGLAHLAGESVMFLADGNLNVATEVNSSGFIYLNTAASVVHVGKKIESEIETLRVSPAQYQGKNKRISYVTIRFFETAGEVILGVAGHMDTVNLGTTLFTGDHRFTFPAGYDEDGKITIQKTDSFPMTILAIIPDIEMYRD